MSRVYLATDLSLDRQVVVKVLARDLSAGVSGARFRREMQLVANLSHPHIIPLLSAGEADGTLYYVMPYLTGEPLRARMAREGPMPVADVVRLLRETLDALAFAHAHGVIHRDIKPENILVSAGHAVVADFGVSKALQESSTQEGPLTSVGIALGTPAYMAPEQAAADPSTDHRADLYSLGVVAYEMLTGTPLFRGTSSQLLRAHIAEVPASIESRRSDVPETLTSLVMRSLAKDASSRPQSAGEMIAALDAVMTPGGLAAPMTTPIARQRSRFASRRPIIVAAAVVLTAIALGAAWLVRRPPLLPGAQSLVVTPFAVADGDTVLVRLGQNLVTTLSANLDGVGAIHVADGTAVLSQARAYGALVSVEAAVEIARRLGARSVLHGTLTRAGRLVRADAALYEIGAPNRAVVRVTATAPPDSIVTLTDSLTWAFLRAAWQSGRSPTPNASSIDTRSQTALREFLDGERLFAGQHHEAASVRYMRAIEADTTFWFAHYRYWVARNWIQLPLDTVVVNRLSRHVEDVKVPERLLIRAELQTSTLTDRLRQLGEVVDRYPMFTAARAALADHLAHRAVLIGYDPRDAVEPWKRVVELVPSDANAVSHLTDLCMVVADLPCLKSAEARFDSLIRADPTIDAAHRGVRDLAKFTLADSRDRLVDQLVDDYTADSVSAIFPLAYPRKYGLLLTRRPNLPADFNRLAERAAMKADRAFPGANALARLRFRIWRGDVGQLDSLIRGIEQGIPRAYRELALQPLYPQAVLLELQALRDPSPNTGRVALARIRNGPTKPAVVVESRWIATVNAILRGDSAAVSEQLAELQRDTSAIFRIASRSVRGLRLGLAGDTAAAAESLLVLERAHGDSMPKVWAAFAANRLMAAKWLTDLGRYAEADSLLQFSQGFVTHAAVAAELIAGPNYLQRSRIAEGLGDRERAAELARIFLAAYDLPSPAAKLWVDEARDRLSRFGGSPDAQRPRETPVRTPRR